ncbi:MMPL family transporter [Streptomyces phaeochromogenes]|uniref:MMPL family transporter n=1 Tax=Streptomyces phaeochromogenes TaxID=1923 RepID=A0ABZ1HPJ3_STRPH|nr:MMPL family transporter [Streptomyces phaeochromogenes]MCX5599374.1 MMPL family transporter [Streptomyces phaeochromogenes]WRZ34950.1 MMPL family transporter [Streptomyces phaeochromogenes]WSD20165.1 MMPL family transporter [Streptomyces phaeochromogenes]
MAVLLHRLGHGAYRHRKLVLGIWLFVLAALITCVGVFGSKLDDRFSVPGTESQRALDSLSKTLPEASGASAQIVFTAPEGHRVTEAPYAAAIARAVAEADRAPQVSEVVDPQSSGAVSGDRTTAIVQIQYPVQTAEVRTSSVDAIQDAARTAETDGLRTSVGGSVFNSKGVHVGPSEIIGVAVALLVLVVTFGSLLAAGMALLPALIGVAVGLAGLLALAPAVSVSSTAVTLALMLGLAVGIDYVLFILSRHRQQLARGTDPKESVALAVGTAGSAVVFAGITVIIALAALSVIGIPFLTTMGLGAAGAVLVAVLAAITLVPAVAGFAGSRLAPKPGTRAARRAADAEGATGRTTLGTRWTKWVIAKPLLTVLAVAGILVTLALPVMDLRLALPDNGAAPHASTERKAYDTISEKFGPGFNGPLLVLAETDDGTADASSQAGAQVAEKLSTLKNVKAVLPPQPTGDPTQSVITVLPASGPDSVRTDQLVRDIREAAPGLRDDTGASVAVTGTTAVNIDVSNRLSDSLLPFVAIVVGLSLLLLMIVFRSLVIPVKAAVGFLLSVGASLGLVVAVFQWGWLADVLGVPHSGPVVSFLPIILIGVLFGLAMDYEVFLVSGMREEWAHTGRARQSVVDGARHSVRVVTAAALIMFTVFAGFFPLDDSLIKPIAFALAVGVAIDAFAVRMTLVPAVLALAGRGAWWLPAWLDRILPDLDVEGSSLQKAAPAEAERKEPEPVS